MSRSTPGVLRWSLPTLGGLLAVATYAFVLVVRGGRLFSLDGDPGRHIRVGTDILVTGRIPSIDLYSHTMGGQPFVPYEWLSEIAFAWAHQLAGLAGAAVLTACLLTSGVVLVYLTMTRWGVPTAIAFLFGFVSFVLQAMHLHARPHMFTTLGVAAFALILHEVRAARVGPRLLLVLVPAMLVWANLHGGFLLGFILLFLFGADAVHCWFRQRTAASARLVLWIGAVVALCFLASLATPAGWKLWPHTTGYLGLDYLVDMTQEYRSPDFHDTLMKFFLLVVLGGTCVLAWLRSPVEPLGLGSFVLFTAFSLHSGRNIPIFAVVMIPWIAVWSMRLVTQQSASSELASRFLDWARSVDRTAAGLLGWPSALLGCAAITAWALAPARRDLYRWDEDRFPVRAVQNLSRFDHPGNVYNQFEWGGYLLYAAWPEVPVFIDGQTDFYGVELTREYEMIRDLHPEWRSLLDKHRVGWALIPPEVPLNQGLALEPRWRKVYEDSTAVAWARSAD